MKSVRFTHQAVTIFCLLLVLDWSCASNDEPKPLDCSTLSVTVPTPNKINPSGCGTNSGSIIAVGSGGTAPYQFSLDGVAFQSDAAFSELGFGSYDITIRDANNCESSVENITLDEFTSTLGVQVPAANIVNPTDCSTPDGTITAVTTGGVGPFTYSLNGGAFQTAALFSGLSAGSYSIRAKDANNCESTVDNVTLSNPSSTLALEVPEINRVDPTNCANPNGSITAVATGGVEPYQFSINNGALQSSASFSNLAPGSYSIKVKDADECENVVGNITLDPVQTTLDITDATTTNSGCKTSNGTITISATGGQPPYEYSRNGTTFISSATISTVGTGTYTVTVRDAVGCSTTKSNVKVLSGVSYNTQIEPILQVNCVKSGCHDGGNSLSNFSNLSTVQSRAASIKTRTGNKSMPDDIAPMGLPQGEIDLIACWVDDGALAN